MMCQLSTTIGESVLNAMHDCSEHLPIRGRGLRGRASSGVVRGEDPRAESGVQNVSILDC